MSTDLYKKLASVLRNGIASNEPREAMLDVANRLEEMAAAHAATQPATAERERDETANARAIRQAIELIDSSDGTHNDERLATIRRVLRGAVLIAEDEATDNSALHDSRNPNNTIRALGRSPQDKK